MVDALVWGLYFSMNMPPSNNWCAQKNLPIGVLLKYLLHSGITMYDPLKKIGATTGTRVGIIGLGGLGTMGVKLAKSMGCEVSAISRTMSKAGLAKTCGADNFIASTDPASMAKSLASLDIILNTIPSQHDWAAYQPLLAAGGKHVMIGIHSAMAASMMVGKLKKCSVVNSVIGGIKNTQEVIDICARDSIYPEIEVVPVQKINEVFSTLDASNDSGIRYVLDLEGSLNESAFNTCKALPPTLGPNHTGMSIRTIAYDIFRMLLWY
jgi:uncharacterized zinc-type alcohol dehydrogenase-like protein